MRKTLILLFISITLFACKKENIKNTDSTEDSNYISFNSQKKEQNHKSSKQYWNNKKLQDFIGNKYNIANGKIKDLPLISSNGTIDETQIMSEMFVGDENEYNYLLLNIDLEKNLMVLFEASKRDTEFGKEVKLKPYNYTDDVSLSYVVNSNGDIDFETFPCFGDSWWECMNCAYRDYTSDFWGKVTWGYGGLQWSAILCVLSYPVSDNEPIFYN